MDPTKSFDHLDPKLKETYARVMGTTAPNTGDTTQPQNPVAQPATPDSTLSASAPGFSQPAAADPNQPLATPTPLQPLNQAAPEGPNPGTGPTINAMPPTTTMFSAPPDPTAAPTPDTNSPATSTFFSNPSPAIADPTQSADAGNLSAPFTPAAGEPAQVPITPYTPDGQPMNSSEQFSQPLPSPSSVAQGSPHQASALLKVLYIIGAVIFFAIYTIFWIKVFNLPFFF